MAQVEGILAAAVTTRREGSAQIDHAAALDILDYLNESKVKGAALLGATGEFPHYDLEERIRLIHLALRRSEMPILVNVSHSCLDGAVRLAEEAIASGAAGLLLMPPYFFRYGQEEVRQFCTAFAEEVESPIPLLLYNLPFFTTEIALDTARTLLTSGLFAGIKDSSGDWAFLSALLETARAAPVTVMIGNDVLFTRGRGAGANGGVTGVGCAVPELMLGLDCAIQAGDAGRVAVLEGRLQEFIGWIDGFPAPLGVREALAMRGLKTGPAPVELGAAAARRMAEFRAWFKSWLPVVREETARVR